MKIKFFVFAKRENSTKRPTDAVAHVEYDVVLKDASSVITPAIELNIGNTTNPRQYNYAYIEEFDRYYWVNNWVYFRGIWTAYLNVDALATWRTVIGGSTQYVLRSAATHDGEITDNLYPMKGSVLTERTNINTLWEYAGSDMNSYGRYVVGVMGNSATTYYMMTPKAFFAFVKGLFSQEYIDTISSTIAISGEEFLTLMSPLNYISSIRWYARDVELGTVGFDPDVVQGTDYRRSISVGFGTVDLSAADASLGNDECVGIHQQYADYAENFVLPQHPQAASRGNYVNREEFTTREIFYPPWGVVSLPADPIAYADAVRLHVLVDYRTGSAYLRAFAFEDDTETTVLCNCEARVGVDCAISATTDNRLSTAATVVSVVKAITHGVVGIVKAGGVIASGGLGEAAGASAGELASGAVSAGGSDIAAAANELWSLQGRTEKGAIPVLNSTGYDGAFASLVGNPHFTSLFYEAVEDDIPQRGRPLCQKRTVSSIPGYMVIADPDVSLASTQQENTRIRAAMVEGFYYE